MYGSSGRVARYVIGTRLALEESPKLPILRRKLAQRYRALRSPWYKALLIAVVHTFRSTAIHALAQSRLVCTNRSLPFNTFGRSSLLRMVREGFSQFGQSRGGRPTSRVVFFLSIEILHGIYLVLYRLQLLVMVVYLGSHTSS